MRIVLIIQSLIILLGAYYVYTLTRTPVESVNDENPSNIEINVRQEEGMVNVEEEDEGGVTSETSGEVIISDGPNDMGMEFPTPDDEDELQVR